MSLQHQVPDSTLVSNKKATNKARTSVGQFKAYVGQISHQITSDPPMKELSVADVRVASQVHYVTQRAQT